MNKHEGKREYFCPIKNCRKAFFEKGNLKTHLRLHTGEKPYQCAIEGCEAGFATQGHLNDHFQKTHTEGKIRFQ
jgi:insecticidal toxin complex protein TccC